MRLRKEISYFGKGPWPDLFCVVQEMKGDQVLLRYMDAPRNEPPISVNNSEIVKLAEEQERMQATDFLEAVARQREIHFPPPKGRRHKKESGRIT